METSTRRTYRMTARAESAAATAERILDAAVEVFLDAPSEDLSLTAVAARAGVTVQTVIRRFGGRDGVFEAALAREAGRVERQRGEVPANDVAAAIDNLVAHYERYGDRIVRVLAEEHRSPAARAVADRGRATHLAWCDRVFADALARRSGTDRRRLRAQLAAVTDVQLWRLLRRERGLGAAQVRLSLRELLDPLLAGA